MTTEIDTKELEEVLAEMDDNPFKANFLLELSRKYTLPKEHVQSAIQIFETEGMIETASSMAAENGLYEIAERLCLESKDPHTAARFALEAEDKERALTLFEKCGDFKQIITLADELGMNDKKQLYERALNLLKQ